MISTRAGHVLDLGRHGRLDGGPACPGAGWPLDHVARALDATCLGTSAYKQKLSTQRAESVKDHLVTSGKVDPMKISATGRGETMPVTQPQDCKGNTPDARLIACLQADRRVEIEVTGTR